LQYLVEKAGVDFEYRYRFNLTHAEDQEIISYLEDRLRDIGVITNKNEVLGLQNEIQDKSPKERNGPVIFTTFESETLTR
jgi:hypothetical protein